MDNENTVNEKPTLYQRLGGEPGLREIVDDIVDRIAENTFLEYYFHNVDKGRIKILAYAYFSMKTGGPDRYTGQDLHSAFYSLNIRPEEYQYALDDVIFILDEKGVGQQEKNEVIRILEELQTEILRSKTAIH
jgi:hemoglobin